MFTRFVCFRPGKFYRSSKITRRHERAHKRTRHTSHRKYIIVEHPLVSTSYSPRTRETREKKKTTKRLWSMIKKKKKNLFIALTAVCNIDAHAHCTAARTPPLVSTSSPTAFVSAILRTNGFAFGGARSYPTNES